VKSDSGSTSDYNAAVSSVPRSHRKRSRDDAIGDDHLNGDGFPASRNPPHKMSKASPFLGHEVGLEIQGRESEIDCLISQHVRPFFSLPLSIILFFDGLIRVLTLVLRFQENKNPENINNVGSVPGEEILNFHELRQEITYC